MNLANISAAYDHLAALLDAGYEVHLEPDYDGSSATAPRYWAHVEKPGEPPRTAEGPTPAEAVWTASPLHADDEPFPGDGCRAAEMSDVLGRLEALERRVFPLTHRHSDDPLSACARCGHLHGGSRCREDGCGCPAWRSTPGWAMDAPDAEEPAGSVCRGCGGQA